MTINMKRIRSKFQQNLEGHNRKWRTSISNLWWKMFVHIFVFSLATNFHVTFALSSQSNSPSELIPTLINAIGKAADFFQDAYEDINIDCLFGLQFGQAQLIESTRWLNKSEMWRKPVQQIIDKMSQVLKLALDNNIAKDNTYAKKFLDMVKQPFYVERQDQQLDLTFSAPLNNIDQIPVYNEEYGDACFARVLGSYVEKGSTLPKCTVTKECLAYMTAPFTTAYYLTHQLLYFIFIQKVGCEGTGLLRQFSERPTIRDINRGFCRRIYEESRSLAQNGSIDPLHQDLFIEQTLLCSPLGYFDFFRTEWINMILSWQDPCGCFIYNPLSKTKRNKRSSSTMRKLLREKVMEGGCLSHKSGLGYGVLTIYLNSLIRNKENNGE